MNYTAALMIATWVAVGALTLAPQGYPLRLKLAGRAPHCSMDRVLSLHKDNVRMGQLMDSFRAKLTVTGYDEQFGIQKVSTPERSYWLKSKGDRYDGKELLAYLLAEHTWTEEYNPGQQVRAGDIVLDCGAHVGVFAEFALRRGASRVVAIEPDRVNLECLRRNFTSEIAAGRVVIVPKGVWSRNDTLTLYEGTQNSGMNSVVVGTTGKVDQIPVVTIDSLVADLGLPRVDAIKMDIEGAEREALAGAMQTLRHMRPRLILDSYHLADDMDVLPSIIRRAHADYQITCGPCELRGSNQVVPHVSYYR